MATLDELDELPVADHVARVRGRCTARCQRALATIDRRLSAVAVAPGSTPNWSAAAWPGPGSRPPSWSPPAGSRSPARPRPSRPPRSTRHRRCVVRATRPTPSYVSRGGHKLAGALAAFGRSAWSRAGGAWTPAPPPAASPTCCSRRAPREVVAVDVGYGQLAWPLRTDARVRVLDRTNVRELTPEPSAARST